MGAIMSLISNALGAITSVMGFLDKKDTENTIRKGYEEEKRADALEEDKVVGEKLSETKDKVNETKDKVKAIRDANLKDAELTEDEVKEELDEIEDEDDQTKRAREIKAAKTLKERKSMVKKKVTASTDFNDGKTISFGG